MTVINFSTIHNIVFGEFQAPNTQVDLAKFKNAKLTKLEPVTEEQLKSFAAKYPINEELGKFLFGKDFALQSSEEQFNKTAEGHFNRFTAEFGYPNLDFAKYLKCYQACTIVADLVEGNYIETEVASRAFKLLVLFDGDLKAAERVLKQEYPVQNPLHDMLMHELPKYKEKDSALDLANWQKLIKAKGGVSPKKVIENFVSAHDLQIVSAEDSQTKARAPKTKEEFKHYEDILIKKAYPRMEESPEFAALCKFYKVDRATFERGLDLLKAGKIKPKTSDLVPDIIIDIEQELPDLQKSGHYLVKLPAGDLRGLILGKITDCCQSVGGDSESVAIDGTNLKNNAFYVLVKAKGKNFDPTKIDWKSFETSGHKIEGQGYIWKSGSGTTLTFDSWENLKNDSNDAMMFKVLQKFAEKVCDGNYAIERVTIGQGGKTPEAIRGMTQGYADGMLEGEQYGDSQTQIEVFVSPALQKAREDLVEITRISDQSHIISIEHAKWVSDTWGKKSVLSDKLESHYLSYSHFGILQLSKKFFLGDEFYKQELDKIDALTSADALAIYKTHELKPDYFKSMEVDKVKALTSLEAQEIYKKCGLKPDDFKDIEVDKIKALTSADAQEIYKECGFKPDDFKDMEVDKINVLTSRKARVTYKECGLKPDDFKDMEVDKVKALTSLEAQEIYKECGLKPDYFKGMEVDKITALTSRNANQIYKDCSLKPDYFKGMEVDKITALTSRKANKIYKECGLKPDDFKGMEVGKIDALTSWDARCIYKTCGLKPDDFKDIEVDKIKALTSLGAQEIYQTYKLKPDDFLGEQEITSDEAKKIVAAKKPFFEELEAHVQAYKDINDTQKSHLVQYVKDHVKGLPLSDQNHDFFTHLCKIATPAVDEEAFWNTAHTDSKKFADDIEDLLHTYMGQHGGQLPDL